MMDLQKSWQLIPWSAGILPSPLKMKDEEPESRNLFCRLFSYIPFHEQERKREPIEDFCTEALAYFLITSETFRQAFVSEMLHPLGEFGDAKLLRVHTQSFSAAEDEAIESNARIDILLEAHGKRIGIESKIDASPRTGQFENYRKHYKNTDLFLLAKWNYSKEYVRDAQNHGFTIIHWEKVQCLMEQYAAAGAADPIAALMSQFARFLATRGMKHIHMTKNPKVILELGDAVRLIDEWSDFLSNRLRITLGFPKGKRNGPYWQGHTVDNPNSFFEINGQGDQNAGFQICESGRVFCIYEDAIEWGSLRSRPSVLEYSEEMPMGCCTEVVIADGGKVYLSLRTNYPEGDEDKTDIVLAIFKLMQEACESRKRILKFEAAAARKGPMR